MVKKKILIVEDEGIVAKDLQFRLLDLGYDAPEIASTGKSAIEKFELLDPDLVLMDIMLRGEMNGIEAATEIRKKANKPIIYLTAYSDDSTLEKAKITDPYGYILKPFEERELHTTIEMALYKHESEQKLKDSEERFRLVAETATDGIITIDVDSTITFVNRATENIFGYSADELIGKSLMKIIPPSLRDRHSDSFQHYLRTGMKSTPWTGIELKGLHKSGSEISFEISFGEYCRGGERLFTGFVRDITERKQAEQQIKILAKFSEDNPNPVLRAGTDGTIHYANSASHPLLQAWNCEINELIPKVLKECVDKVLSTNKSSQTRMSIAEKHYSFTITSYPDIDSVYLYGRDITPQKKIEDELAAEKERLATTLRSIGDGVITTDTDGRILLVNKMAENLTGWSQEEAMGMPLSHVFNIMNEKTRIRCEDPVRGVLERGEIIELANHTILVSKEGTEYIIANSATPIRDTESQIIGVVLVFQNITEKTVLEAEVSKAQKLESLGVLAGGIAHDFNNILTGILGNISLLKLSTEEEDPRFKRMLEGEKAALRAKNLTQQLLTFARGGAPIRISASISDLILDSANFALTGSNVKCEWLDPPEEIWPVEIDPGQMSQVINNLIINADQAMPEGGTIKIKIENFDNNSLFLGSLARGNYVKMTVKDEGVGISPKDIEKIFDPYFTTKPKGCGLGLAICYSIIKNHDGIISVESKAGIGTTFIIYLPGSSKKFEVKKQDYEKSPMMGSGKVLVMDDEDMIREVIAEMLPKLGYTFEVAKDGVAAVEIYSKAKDSKEPFDAVIMDLTVPGKMGGKETVKKVLEINPKAKVIVASGYSNDPIMANYKDYGFFDRIVKPFRIQELGEVLRRSN